MVETYVPLGENWGWKFPAMICVLEATTFCVRRLRKRKPYWTIGDLVTLLIFFGVWAVGLPTDWSLAALFFGVAIAVGSRYQRAPSTRWSKVARVGIGVAIAGFYIWMPSGLSTRLTLTDSSAVISWRGTNETLLRDRTVVRSKDRPWFFNPNEVDWTLEGRHGPQMWWESSERYWGPNGLTTGDALAFRLKAWAPQPPRTALNVDYRAISP